MGFVREEAVGILGGGEEACLRNGGSLFAALELVTNRHLVTCPRVWSAYRPLEVRP